MNGPPLWVRPRSQGMISSGRMTRRGSRLEALTRTRAQQARPELGASPTSSGPGCLVVLAGAQIGRRLELPPRLTVGRDPESGLPLDSDLVSRNHALFEVEQDQVVVTDLQSTNGTFVNDRLITRTTLRDGDRIAIGGVVLKYLAPGNLETRYHDEVFRLMTHDGLTDVYNKTYHDKQLAALCQSASGPLSLLLFDADHFKRINDTYGHAAGDAVLRQLADCARAVVRSSTEDFLSRIGGEEFAVVMPATSLEQATAVAGRIRERVQAHGFVFAAHTLTVTVSIGVATRAPGSNESPQALYQRADAQLYRSKQGGRNRVSC